MSAGYREHLPPDRLRLYVECFWSSAASQAIPEYPVLPDGCVDIVYSSSTGLQVVGAMTRARKFTLQADEFQMGVRFRSGMAAGFIPVPGSEMTDRLLPLHDVWGTKVRRLSEQLGEAKSADESIALLAGQLVGHLGDSAEPGVVQKVSANIIDRSGQVRVDDLAFDAGLSARQLRRLFIEQMGLSPKHFCRVIRFRHSLSRLRASRRGDWADVALECGYYDQAHFINEFREFSGYTPSEFAALPR
jgi:AraC-like DNA-binding protein